jgi:quercetin dioxygenase-like cupin family protein
MDQLELKLRYVEIYADDEGETHFRDVEVPLKNVDYAPPAPLIAVSPHQSATGTLALAFPPGYFGDFHTAPKHQWMIITSGALEIGVSDGEKRTLPAGTIAFLQETGSKGHSTRVIGDDVSILMVTEVT